MYMTRIVVTIVALALAAPAVAINMNGFKDAPITRLSAVELKSFRAAVMQVLDQTPDGTTVEWKAPTTRFVSRITPAKTYTDGKLKCRDAIIESDAQDRFQRGHYSLCKASNGEWQFKLPAAKSKSRSKSK
jgi:surface antigen